MDQQLGIKLACYKCGTTMIEHKPDRFRCPKCGFRAEQMSLESMPDAKPKRVPKPGRGKGKR